MLLFQWSFLRPFCLKNEEILKCFFTHVDIFSISGAAQKQKTGHAMEKKGGRTRERSNDFIENKH